MARKLRCFYETYFEGTPRFSLDSLDLDAQIDYLVNHPILGQCTVNSTCDLVRVTETSSRSSSISSLKTAYSAENLILDSRDDESLTLQVEIHRPVRLNPKLHLSLPLRSKRLQRFCDILSPISDKSQEVSSESENHSSSTSQKQDQHVFSSTKPRPVSLFSSSTERNVLHGSDSGISLGTNSHLSRETLASYSEPQAESEVLPFLMPKLNRNRITAGNNTTLPFAVEVNSQRAHSKPSLNVSISKSVEFAVAQRAVYSVDESLPLEHQSWYHGCITRQEAEALLKPKEEGFFLVRESQSKVDDYFFAVRGHNGILHVQIFSVRGSSTRYGIPLADNMFFESVPSLVSHCIRKGLVSREGIVVFPCLPLDYDII